jgi:serine phosphatase RsbU (regulator of sigma subunit)
MKGIFHSLAQQAFQPKEFMVRANQALKYCLERGSFISATYFVIDSREHMIYYSRAGHCPVLIYRAKRTAAEYLVDKGAALGMVKGNDYGNFVETNSLSYESNDVMVLFTDGITEAKSPRGEEFGLELLRKTISEVVTSSPREIQEHLIQKLYDYTGTEEINDDYTTMIVKFR